MDTINSNSDMSLCSVQIKEEPLDIEPESEELINSSHEVKEELINPADDVKVELIDPADNVKVELEEEEGVKLETNVSIDPLANVQVHYTEETSSSEPSSSRKRPAPSSSGLTQSEDTDILTRTTHFKDYVEIELMPTNLDLQFVRKNSALNFTRKFICNKCSYTTCYRINIKKHKVSVHGDKYKCDKCDYNGLNRSDLSRHLKTEHPEVYKCDQCSYSCTKKDLFKCHTTRSHSTALLSCKLCDFKTKAQTYLMAHVKSKHPKATPYECDACNQSFPSFHSLGRHKRKDHDTQAYFCQLCDYSCKSIQNLQEHERKAHANFILETINSNMLI